MKRKFTFLMAALALLVFMAPSMVGWGQTYEPTTTISVGDVVLITVTTSGNNAVSKELDGISTTSTKYGIATDFSETPQGKYPLTVVSGSESGTFALQNGSNYLSWSSGNSLTTSTTLNKNSSWSISFENSNVVIANANDNTRKLAYNASSPRFACYTTDQTAIQLYKAAASSTVATPTFNPPTGTYTSAQSVTISCETAGSTIYYTTDGSTPTNASTQYTGAISVTETKTIKAIAYVGDEASSVASATYTIVTPLTTMQEIFDAATSTSTQVAITFDNFVISGRNSGSNSNKAFLTDGTKGCIIYESSHGFTAGDILNGTAVCNLVLFGNAAELTGLTHETTGLTVTTGGTVTPVVTTVDQLAAVNTGSVVTFNGLTYDGTTTLKDINDNPVVLSSAIYSASLTSGKKYNITGVFEVNYSNKRINPRSAADIEEVISTDPIINAEDVNIAYNATSGEIAYTITNPVDGQNLTAATTADWISNVTVASDKVTFTCTANEGTTDRTATITLSYGAIDKAVTVTQAGYEAPNVTWDLSTDSYNSATADLVTWSDPVVVMTNAKGSSSNAANNYLGGDANNRTSTRFYSGQVLTITPATGYAITSVVFTATTSSYATAFAGSTWTNATASASETTVTVTPSNGAIAMSAQIGSTCGFSKVKVYYVVSNIPSITVASTTIEAPAAETEGTLNVTYTLIEKENTTDIEIHWFESDGTTATGQPSWIDAEINSEFNVYYVIGVNENEARTAYFKVYGLDSDANDVYSDLVTVTQAAPAAPAATYSLVNNINNLVSGKRYIIASGTNGSVYAMGEQRSNNRQGVLVEASTTGVITGTDDVFEFVIIGPDASGFYTIYDIAEEGYLYAASSSSNYLRNIKPNTQNGRWAITIDNEGEASIVAQGSNTRNTMHFNLSDKIFACYAADNTNQKPIYLFTKDNETPVSQKITVTGFGNDNTVKTGWNLIASPVGQAAPTAGNFLANNYDLYAFNQSEAEEWRNYKQDNFNLVSGHGYLYANSNTVELTFEGYPYVGSGQVFLSYNSEADWKGWNLIGNPYSTNATVNKSYYRMNEEQSEIVANSGPVAAMEGIFVVAENATQYVTFTASRGNSALDNQLALNLRRGEQGPVIDRAIVCFDEGEQLPKFQLFEGSTKVYFTQEGSDYAIVNAEARGEMPVNFKAAENGTYTIDVEAENLEVNYLHLIDNLTGMDVDLLATPSYTFEARKSDIASRFRLRFSANDNNSVSDEFAFVSNGEIVIMNEGEATLQVIDMLGRTVSTQTVDGNARIDKMSANGVYVLRLIDGNEVKTQKIVIE